MRSFVFALVASAAFLSAGSALAGSCDNPYFPLKEGQTRVFKSSTGRESTWKVTKVEGTKASIETTSNDPTKEADARTPARTTAVDVECTSEGINLDLSKMGSSGAQGGMEVKVVKHSGVTIPASAKMKPGETFESTQTLEMGGGRMPQPMTMDAKTTSKVVGTEKVKVAAGEFTAVKIETQTTVTMQMPANPKGGPGGPMTMTSKGAVWVVKDIGMVKNEQSVGGMGPAKGDSTPITSELVSYSR